MWPEQSSVRMVGNELIEGVLVWLSGVAGGEVGFIRYYNEYRGQFSENPNCIM